MPILTFMTYFQCTPQGVARNPLYFTIFIGKVRNCIDEQLEEDKHKGSVIHTREEEGLWTLLFADNTKASAAVSNNQEMNKLQLVLNKIYQGVSTNNMLVNQSKTGQVLSGWYLGMIPDKPRDAKGGWYPNPVDTKGHFSNSLVFGDNCCNSQIPSFGTVRDNFGQPSHGILWNRLLYQFKHR